MPPSTRKIHVLEHTLNKLEQSQALLGVAPIRARLDSPPHGPARVSNVGLLNAGKSTLFNALCGDPSYFATSDARCTTAEQTIELDGYVLVDTPGLDANKLDDDTAAQITNNADMLLFIHNIKAGELDRQEADFLERLEGIFPDREMLSHTVLPVFTHCEGHSPQQLDELLEEVLNQWTMLTGTRPSQTFQVRSETYLRGLEKGDARFCDASGVPQLAAFIREQRDALNQRRNRLWWARIEADVEHLVEELRGVLSEKENELKSLVELHDKRTSAIQLDFVQFEANIRQTHANYEARKRSI